MNLTERIAAARELAAMQRADGRKPRTPTIPGKPAWIERRENGTLPPKVLT